MFSESRLVDGMVLTIMFWDKFFSLPVVEDMTERCSESLSYHRNDSEVQARGGSKSELNMQRSAFYQSLKFASWSSANVVLA